MAFILGKKVGMTQVFDEKGTVTPVTVIKAGPIFVTQIRTKDKDGYVALQVGYGTNKRMNKPKRGHLSKAKIESASVLKEFRTDEQVELGGKIDVTTFEIGDKVRVTGLSKAKGFQGVVKRHNFGGAPASHGHHKVLRHAGSIGQRFPQHTLKGLRMAGRMGGVSATSRGLKIVSVDQINNTIAVSGSVPGRKGTLLKIISQ